MLKLPPATPAASQGGEQYPEQSGVTLPQESCPHLGLCLLSDSFFYSDILVSPQH